MNAAHEEWGEERLIETVQHHYGTSADGLVSRIVESVDAFVAGCPQHDDMTVVVLRGV